MVKPSWTLQKVKIADIKEFEKNPRWLTQKQKTQLKKSLQKFGVVEKPIVNKDLTLIGGHQRLQVLLELGEKEVECWIPDKPLTAKEHEELNVRLNQNGGTFDFDKLANEFDCKELLAWGFEEKDLIGKFEIDEENESEESAPKSKKKTCPECGHKF
jgi:ParB-like chromosome segregation protein Spo0J